MRNIKEGWSSRYNASPPVQTSNFATDAAMPATNITGNRTRTQRGRHANATASTVDATAHTGIIGNACPRDVTVQSIR